MELAMRESRELYAWSSAGCELWPFIKGFGKGTASSRAAADPPMMRAFSP